MVFWPWGWRNSHGGLVGEKRPVEDEMTCVNLDHFIMEGVQNNKSLTAVKGKDPEQLINLGKQKNITNPKSHI